MGKRILTTLVRFERKFTRGDPDACWEWQAGRDKDGYGTFYLGVNNKRAHRVSFQLYRGDVPSHLKVCHQCDNPPCVNPNHLFLGTAQDNNTDMTIKERGGKRKLTATQIPEIRARLANGEKAYKIAEDYGMTAGPFYRIQNRQGWKHVP